MNTLAKKREELLEELVDVMLASIKDYISQESYYFLRGDLVDALRTRIRI